MNRTTAAAIALLAAFTLAGCAGTTSTLDTVESPPTPIETGLVAEQTDEPSYSDEDAEFVAELFAARERRAGGFETQIPDATDQQLIDAAHEACEQMADGTDLSEVQVVEGETPHPQLGTYADSSLIAAVAKQVYCP